jgi:hypothetical protein
VRSKTVLTQADDANHTAYVENVMWMESTVVFSTLNVPGSNNDTVPWTGAWAGDPDQAAEVSARNAANMAWLSKTFDTAEANDANGVALILQADMWDSFGTAATLNGFDALVKCDRLRSNCIRETGAVARWRFPRVHSRPAIRRLSILPEPASLATDRAECVAGGR